jgi:hypothetical protein
MSSGNLGYVLMGCTEKDSRAFGYQWILIWLKNAWMCISLMHIHFLIKKAKTRQHAFFVVFAKRSSAVSGPIAGMVD